MTDTEWAEVLAYAERAGVPKVVEAMRQLIRMGLDHARDCRKA